MNFEYIPSWIIAHVHLEWNEAAIKMLSNALFGMKSEINDHEWAIQRERALLYKQESKHRKKRIKQWRQLSMQPANRPGKCEPTNLKHTNERNKKRVANSFLFAHHFDFCATHALWVYGGTPNEPSRKSKQKNNHRCELAVTCER